MLTVKNCFVMLLAAAGSTFAANSNNGFSMSRNDNVGLLLIHTLVLILTRS